MHVDKYDGSGETDLGAINADTIARVISSLGIGKPADFTIPKEDEEGDSYITITRTDAGWVIDPAEADEHIESSADLAEVAALIASLLSRHHEVVEIEDDLSLLDLPKLTEVV